MNRKISVGMTVTIVILAMTVTFFHHDAGGDAAV